MNYTKDTLNDVLGGTNTTDNIKDVLMSLKTNNIQLDKHDVSLVLKYFHDNDQITLDDSIYPIFDYLFSNNYTFEKYIHNNKLQWDNNLPLKSISTLQHNPELIYYLGYYFRITNRKYYSMEYSFIKNDLIKKLNYEKIITNVDHFIYIVKNYKGAVLIDQLLPIVKKVKKDGENLIDAFATKKETTRDLLYNKKFDHLITNVLNKLLESGETLSQNVLISNVEWIIREKLLENILKWDRINGPVINKYEIIKLLAKINDKNDVYFGTVVDDIVKNDVYFGTVIDDIVKNDIINYDDINVNKYIARFCSLDTLKYIHKKKLFVLDKNILSSVFIAFDNDKLEYILTLKILDDENLIENIKKFTSYYCNNNNNNNNDYKLKLRNKIDMMLNFGYVPANNKVVLKLVEQGANLSILERFNVPLNEKAYYVAYMYIINNYAAKNEVIAKEMFDIFNKAGLIDSKRLELRYMFMYGRTTLHWNKIKKFMKNNNIGPCYYDMHSACIHQAIPLIEGMINELKCFPLPISINVLAKTPCIIKPTKKGDMFLNVLDSIVNNMPTISYKDYCKEYKINYRIL